MKNAFHEFLRNRQSIRRFKPESVPDEILNRILETTIRAPSAHNRQPWRFVIVKTKAAKENLATAMGVEFHRDMLADGLDREEIDLQVRRSFERITGSPVVILLCMTLQDMDTYFDRARKRAEFRMAMQSVALAGGQMLLAAHAEGLGAVWVCSPLFAQKAVQGALSLPEDWEPHAMILMGYPQNIPKRRNRAPFEEVTAYR